MHGGRIERAVLAQLKQLEKNPAAGNLTGGVFGRCHSLALAAALIRLAPARDFRLVAATVDHGWRPESGIQARKVQALLAGLGYRQVEILTLSSAQISGHGKEGEARKKRYLALEEAAGKVRFFRKKRFYPLGAYP